MHIQRVPASDAHTSIPACSTDQASQASIAVNLAVRPGVHAHLVSWEPRPGCCPNMANWDTALASAGNTIAAPPTVRKHAGRNYQCEHDEYFKQCCSAATLSLKMVKSISESW